MTYLQDPFGRQFPYLRLSVTDVCNFRCTYCLPHGYQGHGQQDVLSVNEIRRLVTAFAALGTRKVRLTGGEPMTRSDIIQIIQSVSDIPGIETVALTTNGYKLKHFARDLAQSGLSHLNVSIDSLDPQIFARVTGHDRLYDILEGVTCARNAGISPVRINAVLMRGVNDTPEDIALFETFLKHHDIDVRFIELMQTGDHRLFFDHTHIPMTDMIQYFVQQGWHEVARATPDGPARYYQRSDYLGRVGFIAPYSPGFCQTCNRLRVSARGRLRLCLFSDGDHNLRSFLQSDADMPHLHQSLIQALSGKPATHKLAENNPGSTRHLAEIGG